MAYAAKNNFILHILLTLHQFAYLIWLKTSSAIPPISPKTCRAPLFRNRYTKNILYFLVSSKLNQPDDTGL